MSQLSAITGRTSRPEPRFWEPMLCLPVPALPAGIPWVYELQWDGYRVQGIKTGPRCRLLSRNGHPLSLEFPEVLPALFLLQCQSAVVDGELIAIGEHGHPSFELLQFGGSRRLTHLVLFDLLMLDGHDLRSQPLWVRRAALKKIFPANTSRLSLSPQMVGDPDDLLDQVRGMQLPGVIAKRTDSPYESGGRSGFWLKYRPEQQGAFFIGGFIPGAHGFEELLIGEKQGRRFRFAARLRNGFVPATRRSVSRAIAPLHGATCPFDDLPRSPRDCFVHALDAATLRRCVWVEPSVQIDVAFTDRVAVWRLRHPRFRNLRATTRS